jgi:hypothetical protein
MNIFKSFTLKWLQGTPSKFLILALLLAVNQLRASLGETEAEVTAKYGKPIVLENGRTDRESKKLYDHDGYRITVKFLDGKSGYEEYTKDDLINIHFSDDEIRALLISNCLGLQWNRLRSTEKEPTMEKNWELRIPEKTVAVATTKFPYTKLTVATSEFVRYNSGFEMQPKERADTDEP